VLDFLQPTIIINKITNMNDNALNVDSLTAFSLIVTIPHRAYL